MFLPQSLEQQAGHSRTQMALQQPQGEIVVMAVGAAGLAKGQHDLFGVHGSRHDGGILLRAPIKEWLRRLFCRLRSRPAFET